MTGFPRRQRQRPADICQLDRLIVDSMGEGAAVVSPDDMITLANSRLAAMTGRPTAELAGTPAVDLVPEPSRPEFTRLLDVTPGRQVHGQADLTAAQGAAIRVTVTVSAAKLDGQVQRCLILADLTRRMTLENRIAQVREALGEQHAILEQAGTALGLGWYVADPQESGNVSASPEVYQILGVTAHATRGKSDRVWESIHPDDLDRVRKQYAEALATGQPYSSDLRIIRPDGSLRWVRHSTMVKFDPAGTPTRVFGVVQDITDRKEAEAALAQAKSR